MNGWGNLKETNMTPKEKAQELILTFYSEMNPNAPDCNLSMNQCKRCALICVDEIISACEYNNVESYNTTWWNKVKQEIEKL